MGQAPVVDEAGHVGIGQRVEGVGADEDTRARDAAARRQPTEVADVVGAVELDPVGEDEGRHAASLAARGERAVNSRRHGAGYIWMVS